jgi:hypothetical protein
MFKMLSYHRWKPIILIRTTLFLIPNNITSELILIKQVNYLQTIVRV